VCTRMQVVKVYCQYTTAVWRNPVDTQGQHTGQELFIVTSTLLPSPESGCGVCVGGGVRRGKCVCVCVWGGVCR
jgi:hypothetical protein